MLVGGLDVGELRSDLLDGAAPEVPGVGQHVVLVHQGQVPAGAGLRAGERVTHDALDAEAGVDADLSGHLGRCADAQRAPVAGVGTLGTFAHDHEVDAVGRHPGHVERARDAGEQPGGAQIDVVVEGEPQGQQHAAFEHPARHARVADGPQEDGVVLAELRQHGVGQGLPRRMPTPCAEVVVGGGELRAVVAHDGLEHLQPFADDLRADAVAADDRDRVGVLDLLLSHGASL